MIPGFILFLYCCAGAWLAEHRPRMDSRVVRFLCWFHRSRPVRVIPGGRQVWRRTKKGRSVSWYVFDKSPN